MMGSTAQLLVVSPDNTVLRAAGRCVLALGHAPFLARSVGEAQRTLIRVQIDLLCFDSVLPTGEMERFWRWLCTDQDRSTLPVILLSPASARLVPAALPSFFQPQRDGLVAKPLESRELARVVARLLAAGPRRRREADLLRVGSVTLDGARQQLLFDSGGALPLTRTEYRLVRYLMQRPGDFVSPDELLEQVWGYPPGTGGPEVVRSHVSNLRRKLRGMGEDSQLLCTLPYQGYSLIGGTTRSSP